MKFDNFEILCASMVILLVSAAVAPLFAGRRKLAGWINFVFVLSAGSLLLYLCWNTIFQSPGESSITAAIGPLRLHLLIDGLSCFFIAIIAFMGIMSALYSIEYMEHYPEYSLAPYYLNFPIFLLGMTGIAVVDDLTTGFTIAWQAMTISSFFLIRFESRKKENIRGASKYLILMELAWLIILFSTTLVSGAEPGDPVHIITEKMKAMDPAAVSAVLGLLFLGFALKAGIFPLGQLWLPDAHSIAPSPISALLSGVMIKTGIYGIIRTFMWMMPAGDGTFSHCSAWGAVVSTLGVVTLFIGTVQSMKQSDSKRLLAYSSIGQIGYIVLGIGASIFLIDSASPALQFLAGIALIGAVYHVLNHAVFKGLLFLSSGSVLYATGIKDLNRLGGLMNLMPLTALIAGVASLSISGVPAFSGFASKWTIISSSILAGSEVLFLAIFGIIALFTSAITLACYVKFFGMTFASAGAEWNTKNKIKEVPWKMILPKALLTMLCLIQGLAPVLYYKIIISIFQNSGGSSFSGLYNSPGIISSISGQLSGVRIMIPGFSADAYSAVTPVIILIVFALSFTLAAIFKKAGGSKERAADTWLCGYQTLNNQNRYLDKNMFSALKDLFLWTGAGPGDRSTSRNQPGGK